ncbi:MAG: GNAT family N-acetyltransferase [Candidatus Atabeyarchaeum deiterrae]
MTELVIRPAIRDDIPSICEVNLSSKTRSEIAGFTAPEFATFSSPDVLAKVWARRNRLKDGFEVIVAEKDGRVVGFIVFKKERGYVDIDNVDIRKDEQGKGVGRALVTHVENIAITSGHSLMKTDTTENAQGVPWKSYVFWTRMGYRDTGERLRTKYGFKTIPFVKSLK